ncbi:hypothetical protein J518_0649 [Acinetobacter baumannii 1419130]|nr:hypothetical protein J518_0649 [Acinetobacter baumannii 1419130]
MELAHSYKSQQESTEILLHLLAPAYELFIKSNYSIKTL